MEGDIPRHRRDCQDFSDPHQTSEPTERSDQKVSWSPSVKNRWRHRCWWAISLEQIHDSGRHWFQEEGFNNQGCRAEKGTQSVVPRPVGQPIQKRLPQFNVHFQQFECSFLDLAKTAAEKWRQKRAEQKWWLIGNVSVADQTRTGPNWSQSCLEQVILFFLLELLSSVNLRV